MKKWMKWTLGIIGLLAVVMIIIIARMWSSFTILRGTEELSGEKEIIPKILSVEQKPLTKGDADWISWLGANGDSRSGIKGIIKDWSGGLTQLWEVNFLCQGDFSATWSAPVIQGSCWGHFHHGGPRRSLDRPYN